MAGIKELNNREFIRAFQAIDGIIQKNHPIFILLWPGSVIVLIVTTVYGVGYLDVTGQGMPSGGGQMGSDMHGGGMHGGPGGRPPSGENMGGDQSGQRQQPDIGKLASPSKMWIKQVKLAETP